MLQHNRQKRPTRPLRRGRPRAQVACISCKERKLKVGRIPDQSDAMMTCLVEDLSTKRHIPRNYLETLEERVEALEGLLQRESQAQPSQSGHRSREVDQGGTASSREDNDAPVDLVSKAGVLSLQASGSEPHYFGPSSMFSFSRVIHSCVRQVVNDKSAGEFDLGLGELSNSAVSPCRLPSYEVGLVLSNAYFENVHLQYPFLHEPTFRTWEKNAAGLDCACATPTELFFVNMASAQDRMDHLWTMNLSGLALRQCIELGYHRNVKKINVRTNLLKLELRKRAFWCAYQMDCAASVNVGLPLSLPIEEVDTEFPLDIDDANISQDGIQGLPRLSSGDPITTVSHALHQFRVRCLWARIYASLYSNAASKRHDEHTYQIELQKLRKELDDWMAVTPPEPRRANVPLTVFASMEDYRLTYNETIIFLYRRQLTSGVDVQEEVILECMQAAASICQSCKRLYIGKPINYTWTTLHVLFLAGLTYLHCLWSSSSARRAVKIDSVSRIFTTCTMLLAIMAERWEGAAPYRNLFEALSSRTMAMMVERNQDERSEALLAPSTPCDPAGANVEDLTQWASQIADTGMPDSFGSLLTGIVGDFGTEQEAQEFFDSLWNL
ncbi:subtilisin-like protease [Colletotrichum plurivorum]|uniref:Subtilisin-like protease n=1 Tax=Colletotrichum plurivorum TaxID=2175906 RepID=A0A8H6KSF2_9PEZI|nr:subtilisin-like protease [Colletotrichum plurivorum]